MKKRVVALFMAAALTAGMLAGCGSSKESTDDRTKAEAVKEDEAFGDTIKYDPSQKVNDGKEVTVDLWQWGEEALFKQITDAYTKLQPHVKINIVNNPWEDYWTKLPLALKGDKGPALFNIHNSQHQNIINYLAPYDIPTEDLEADFTGVDAHVIDGKVYYIDYGIMTGSVYYNKDMWEAAGLTDADIPHTWDEFREVAKKLTISEGDKFQQVGINFNDELHSNYLMGLNYQLGDNLFDSDMKTIKVDTDNMKKIMQMLVDMYDKDKSGSKDFGEKASESFGQGMSAMTIQWGWYNNSLNNDYPDINFGVFEIPVFEDDPYAYNRYNGESTFGINKNASPEEQAVAQDFVKFFLAYDGGQKLFNLEFSPFPAKKSLAGDTEILANPAMAAIADHIDRYVWPGPMPAIIEDTLKIAGQDIMFNGKDMDAAFKDAEATINKELKSADFESVENLYKYAE